MNTYCVWLAYELFRGAITSGELDWNEARSATSLPIERRASHTCFRHLAFRSMVPQACDGPLGSVLNRDGALPAHSEHAADMRDGPSWAAPSERPMPGSPCNQQRLREFRASQLLTNFPRLLVQQRSCPRDGSRDLSRCPSTPRHPYIVVLYL
jgi:hypothetical protein